MSPIYDSASAFALTCACGRSLEGERQRRHQVIACASCGRSHFVLPMSPFDLPAPAAADRRPRWRRLLAAAALVLLLAGVALLRPWQVRLPPADPMPEDDPAQLRAGRDAARRALVAGQFHVAFRQIDALLVRRDRHPDWFSAEENRAFNQLHRQADLLARLLTRPLGEVVQQGMLVRDPAEWEAQVAEYRGRTVIFDDLVRADDGDQPVLVNFTVTAGRETVRVALEDLEVLHDLPLEDAPRMIFGGRVSICRREEGGRWVVHFEPDSGVLLTDPDLWQASTALEADEDVRRTLARQLQWLEDGRVVHPARRPAD